ncbi:cation acetate symporter [Luteolibacter yonseiensis]|uniref:Cation acetate symporter n=1 Tax=Luteolibacter yonseiensis TaxID=1144680 RepID=A0A934VAZ1_9BACT|nr:cation acetate symporter [Luteolibacter yonseiensis]MBK1815391.1 cation acetate symporter [Luteolibacter yonseiensis]
MDFTQKIDGWILAFSAITVVVTIIMGFRSAKSSKSASDFFVAGRSVSVGWNASAISGEYLSAASFMGIAGMVMLSGYDALWYPVCYACGYLFLLLFIAGPLRRFGAYTIPDFAEGRYDSPVFRKIAVCFVLFIGFFYTMPQMKGAGTTLAYIFPGLPYWVGVAVVGAVITLNVALGGMKGITLVQAVQYWIKMFAISAPIFVLLFVYGGYGKNLSVNKSAADPAPIVRTAEPATAERLALPEKAPKDESWIAPFGPLTTKAAKAAGLSPEETRPLSLLYTFSLIVALVCGTAGLPHILVRFYTNPDGVAAKKTTMWVMILIGVFYVFPPVFGVLGRNFLPELYAATGSKGPDKVVLELPILIRDKYGALGSILSGITCAGAFAAFMSTFSGLLVSMTGALAHDVYGRMLRPTATAEERMKMFKWCAVLVGTVSVGLGSLVEPLEINFMVGQAFAIAAASYFPLLFMSVWWRGMTMKGAATGMLTGGLCALVSAAVVNVSTLALDKGPMGKVFASFVGINDFWKEHPLLRILCEQPAIWSVPLSIGLMIVVSKATRSSIPKDARMKMLVLHAPEALGLKQEYIQEQQGAGH